MKQPRNQEKILSLIHIAELWCPVCGKTWKYKTNSEQAEVTARCIQCGAEMVSRWNSKKRRYLPKK